MGWGAAFEASRTRYIEVRAISILLQCSEVKENRGLPKFPHRVDPGGARP